MTIQRLFHSRTAPALLGLAWLSVGGLAQSDPLADGYPTVARVEYVNDCIAANGGKLANLYQCSCVIDFIATRLSYDEFVAAGTFARYANLPGEGGGIFRDPAEGKKMAKLYRELESEARGSCGLVK
jgi:hypothetical protein